ncbi:FAD-dependent oxidoreductase [Bacillus sp. HMF5848]|uniref:FAD-dependent oxidoreductase n=1 Tax=Bacillus sp. HMF5848 TaxID=2495421 RepID=UPI000F78CE31|nr:FAD-dependent oxidoreductase [Bacillus sp. HMF5848]RSK29072.1 FAD-dependent oxidoreductase [Bacillus sp. HMF5848]
MEFNQKVKDEAAKIVDGCMGHDEAFCVATCPMHTDVKKYVAQIGLGRYEDALLTIREKLFLPNTLGRICAHPCESVCRRNEEFAQPISIAALKRFAAEKADRKELWDTSVGTPTGRHVCIVGAGPAGAQAAIDLRRQGHEVTIYEKLHVVGGMMRVGIPEYRLPRDVIDFEYSYLEDLGVEMKMGVEIGKDITFAQLKEQYDAVIIAHGAHKGSKPPVPGVEADGVFHAVEYLKEISLTHAFPKAGKRVAVVGGGDVAMDCARSSWRIGAEEVYLISLEELEKLPASHFEVEEALEEGVKFVNGWGTQEIISENGRISSVKVKRVKSMFDEEGRFNPTFIDEEMTLEVDTLIFATGQIVEDISGGLLEQTRGGRYVVDADTLATNIENVFVAGDASGGNIVVQAMALGRKAATSIGLYFEGKALTEGRNFVREYSYETNLNVPLPKGTVDLPRTSGNLRSPEERKLDFVQADLGYTEEQALKEAGRCLQCECKLCMDECIMMNDYGECPQDIFKAFLETGTIDPIIPYSCNVCGGCTHVCPNDFPMGDVFMGMRKDMIKQNNGKSPMPGHKAIEMHQMLGFSKIFCTKVKGAQ